MSQILKGLSDTVFLKLDKQGNGDWHVSLHSSDAPASPCEFQSNGTDLRIVSTGGALLTVGTWANAVEFDTWRRQFDEYAGKVFLPRSAGSFVRFQDPVGA